MAVCFSRGVVSCGKWSTDDGWRPGQRLWRWPGLEPSSVLSVVDRSPDWGSCPACSVKWIHSPLSVIPVRRASRIPLPLSPRHPARSPDSVPDSWSGAWDWPLADHCLCTCHVVVVSAGQRQLARGTGRLPLIIHCTFCASCPLPLKASPPATHWDHAYVRNQKGRDTGANLHHE